MSNKYAGKCHACGCEVHAGQGKLEYVGGYRRRGRYGESVKPWSRIRGLNVHYLDANPNDLKHFFPSGEIPDEYLWAYRHIIDHDCGSLICGKTVFEVVYNELR